jgi:HK97 gp10 family phage protein
MANGKTGVTIRIVSNHCAAMADGIHAGAVAEVKRAAFEIEAAGKAKAPVRTGLLRRSITTQTTEGGLRAEIGPSVQYGPMVEFGTRHMGARPYMRPAAELVYPRFIDRLKVVLRSPK